MNKTEGLAYKWLLKQGYGKDDIVFQPRRSPDFILSDGRWIEIKKRYGNTILFTDKQFNALKGTETEIIVFDIDSESPITSISAGKIMKDAVIKGLKITVAPTLKGTDIAVSRQLKGQLDAIKERNGHQTYDSIMRYFLFLEKGIPCKGEKCVWYWNCMEYGCPKFKEKEEEE